MNANREIVSLTNVIKNYGHGEVITKALQGIDLKINQEDFSVIMGPSGCGKSTMLNIIGGLDKTTSGEVKFDGKDFNSLTNKELSIIRRNQIGFVFQNYNLLPVLTAYENAEYVLMLQEMPVSDSETAQSLLLLMEKLNKINKTTFLISTHDPAVIKFAKKVIVLNDGRIDKEELSSENI